MNPAAAAPPPGQQVIHVTQDLDTELEALFNAVMNPRPSSWRKKILPESFFREPDSGSHSRQSSTDSGGPPARLPPVHVRSHSSPASLPGAGAAPQHGHLRQRSCDVTDERPLPPGWEMALTQTGQRYFLNHIEKITTWQDPRKAVSQPLGQGGQHAASPAPHRAMATSQPNLLLNSPVPPGPALAQQSRPPQPPALLALPGSLPGQQQQQQQLRLQRIQMERERIRMRQEELLRQEAALCRQLPMDSENLVPVQTAVNTPALTQDMRPITNNGSDPFLSSGPYHSREQSTDSGLGLGCYSIPTTPEDFLSNVDEMDTGETVAQTTMSINPQQTRFPDFLDCLPGTNVDLGTLESEDLIPILNDVESQLESVLNKNEPFLTWL
ncbi:PREDICTED: WW domain-containing transcription regulator protein 1 [Sturnus vulgaris]|uniref:WW domain-containing transcription regulator protein 1 n=1 Tax=Sturnus vulgaris TaxID=9172 RepID=UPI000719FB03|nr:PREDICTED: WW domain-containing transcription regulator protein 1 [Sturnus vulgaris]